MPVSTLRDTWKLWMAAAQPRGWACDALEFIVEGQTIRLANRLAVTPEQTLTHEDGFGRVYKQLSFIVGRPAKQMNSEYALSVTMDNAPSALLDAIGKLHGSQLFISILVRYRIYLLPDNDDGPAIRPAMQLNLAAATMNRTSLQLSCLPITLSKKRAGQTYTTEEFPGLARF